MQAIFEKGGLLPKNEIGRPVPMSIQLYKTHSLDLRSKEAPPLSLALRQAKVYLNSRADYASIPMMRAVIPTSALVLLSLARTAASSGPTSIFIDKIPEYALLATCAEQELSTIVRNMEYGCGDGGGSTYTSFACFCYESSAKFSSMIGAHVATRCPEDTSQNTTALQVFSSYCDVGQEKLGGGSSSTRSVIRKSRSPFMGNEREGGWVIAKK
jgi:hypothetical protein